MEANMNDVKDGYIYILTSSKTEYVKIGGTNYPPLKRIREINSTEPYKSLGPWSLFDFRQVSDWRKVEYNLHYRFRSKKNNEIDGQMELFRVAPIEASKQLDKINPGDIINKPKVDRLFQDEQFCGYLMKLFNFTGLLNWLDIQGIWTLVLFPATSGGRYFTINIGTHEVAFSTLKRMPEEISHMICMDGSILNSKPVKVWLKSHNGSIKRNNYSTALPRSVLVIFSGDFNAAEEFMRLDGVRRAVIAYWGESLLILKEKGGLSLHSRFHNYNAVAEINKKQIDVVSFSPLRG
jgi:hypothetical protein